VAPFVSIAFFYPVKLFLIKLSKINLLEFSGEDHQRQLQLQPPPPKTLGPITATASPWHSIHQNANFMTAKTVLRFFLTRTWR